MSNNRTCDVCNKHMNDGYIISDGMEYYCSNECLYSVYTEDEYVDMYNNDYAFWTTFEDENTKLKVLELFAGTKSISNEFEKRGHETFTIEWDEKHEGIDWYTDIMNVTAQDILEKFGRPDVIWSSNDCTKFSVAAIGRHWIKGTNLPKTEETKQALALLEHTVNLIKELNPKCYFIENPRGKMRKMDCMQELPRHTVTYCQYGDTRMKPTDLWTNHPNPKFKPPCKNGDTCHEPAPRGSRTGTQGIKGTVDRSRIPKQLCEHIVDICEEYILENK